MSLWGKTDELSSAPKYLLDPADFPAANVSIDYGGLPMQTDVTNAYFVDATEATVTSNRDLGIKTPGWVLFKEYGTGRKYVETLVAMKVAAADAGDAGVSGNTAIEDDTVADS